MKPLLIRHLEGEDTGRFPVWLMRQAGRYMQSYRDIRKDSSFWEMVKSPELAAKVSLLPIEEIGVDAVIFFSDILTPAFGQGLPITMKENIGPVNESPLQGSKDYAVFQEFESKKHTEFVNQALRLIRKQLAPEKALIGFAGAPWTVSAYLGKSGKSFDDMKAWLYRDPDDLALALGYLGKATRNYLQGQVDAGADMIQLFDTWASEIPLSFFKSHYKKVIVEILSGFEVPVVYFPRAAHHLLHEMKDMPMNILGCDAYSSLSQYESVTEGNFSLQGNLDPLILLEDPKIISLHTQRLVAEARTLKKPAILNLGHGIRKQTPIENVKHFVKEAQKPWT